MDNPKPPEIVLASHGDLARVQELLAADPALLHVMYAPWKEDPIGAASHVGNRPIAEYLLQQGAAYRITTAAMLGRLEDMRAFLARDASLANAAGAHDISLLFHAAMSGIIPIVELIVEKGGSLGDASQAFAGAVRHGRLEMAEWLLARGADPNTTNFQGQTALKVANELGLPELSAAIARAGGHE
jgi:ankyrin repeat protein